MKMIGRAVATVGVAALVMAGAPAGPAAADPACVSGEVCLYYRGSLIYKGPPVTGTGCRRIQGQFDYVRNLSSVQQRAWSGTECNGRVVVVPAGRGATVDQFWSFSRY